MSYDDFDSDGATTGERRSAYGNNKSNYRSSSSNQKSVATTNSILKNSPLRKSNQYSDDEDDNYNISGRSSNRNYNNNAAASNRFNANDSPLNSYRSDRDAGKPPSGRLIPLQPSNSGLDRDFSSRNNTNNYEKFNNNRSESTKKSLPSLSYANSRDKNNSNDSDDPYTDSRFTKKKNNEDETNSSKYDKYDRFEKSDRFSEKKSSDQIVSKYERFDYNKNSNNNNNDDKSIDSNSMNNKYDRFDNQIKKPVISDKYDRFDIPVGGSNNKKETSLGNKYNNNLDKYDKFDTKYDTYDEDDIKKPSDLSNKYFRSEGPLKGSSNPLDSLDLYSSKNVATKAQRSNSLDRIHSAYNQILSSNTMTSTGGGSGAGGPSSSGIGNSGRLSKFNSTSNLNSVDNASDRSYTINSLNNTNLSVKEAKSRSYLVGSLSAINGKGLLSGDELERNLAEKRARILVATWNMGGTKKLSDNLDELLLPEMIQTMPDIYVIGVQEFELNQKEWEICLQEQIGPTHVKYTSYYHGSIGLCVFIKRELIWFCSVVEFEHINLRAGPINTPNATKASVLVSFQLFGTLMCFICSHFASGEGHVEQRIDNYKTTINSIKLPNKLLTKNRLLAADGTDNFDCVFWLGDFNFRVDKERNKVVDKIADMRKKKSINYEDIMNHDELNRVIDEDKAFKNFLEGRITFEPTYKYELNSDEYDRSEKCRIPSYTDRIMFRSRQKGIISCSFYDSVKEIKISDHRPVYGVYEVNIRPGVDTIPLSYGEFDRQVYQAGYQKRQMFRACNVGFNTKNNTKTKKSSPCSIQ